MVEKLDWDSAFFGLRIAKAEVDSQVGMDDIEQQIGLLRQQYDLIYVFAHHPIMISRGDPVLVDEKLVYSAKTHKVSVTRDQHIVEYKQGMVSEQLLNLALESGVYSRFRVDSRLPAGSYERLYTRWIEQSVNHTIATEVFCYMLDETPLGLITLKRDADVGDIGLVATDQEYRGRGIGKAMIAYVMDYAHRCGCNAINVTTQFNNLAARRLYESSGMQIKQTTYVWHWWLS